MQEKESSDTEKANVWGVVDGVIGEILKAEGSTFTGKCNLIVTVLILFSMLIQAVRESFDWNEYSFMLLIFTLLMFSLMLSARSCQSKKVSELRQEF